MAAMNGIPVRCSETLEIPRFDNSEQCVKVVGHELPHITRSIPDYNYDEPVTWLTREETAGLSRYKIDELLHPPKPVTWDELANIARGRKSFEKEQILRREQEKDEYRAQSNPPINVEWTQDGIWPGRMCLSTRVYVAYHLIVQAWVVLTARRWSSGEIWRPPRSWGK